jgi:hypothetical protein
MAESYGILWKVLECSRTFLCKIVYIDLNPTSKRKTGTYCSGEKHSLLYPHIS